MRRDFFPELLISSGQCIIMFKSQVLTQKFNTCLLLISEAWFWKYDYGHYLRKSAFYFCICVCMLSPNVALPMSHIQSNDDLDDGGHLHVRGCSQFQLLLLEIIKFESLRSGCWMLFVPNLKSSLMCLATGNSPLCSVRLITMFLIPDIRTLLFPWLSCFFTT